MSNINIKRFVDVNITYHESSTIASTRDTAVLLVTEDGKESGASYTYSNYASLIADTDQNWSDATKAYAKVYFDNGGLKLLIVTGVGTSASDIVNTIKSLDDKYIVIAYNGLYANIKAAAQLINSQNEDPTLDEMSKLDGIKGKILLGCTDSATDSDSIRRFAVKYSKAGGYAIDGETAHTKVIGAEMAIAAYLSQINVYGLNTIQDYCFTKEVFQVANASGQLIDNPEPLDDDTYKTCMSNNLNVDIYLANSVRNTGGNDKAGFDLVNDYTLIVLHQTLTERLLNLLTQKIKGNAGIAAMSAVISQEMNRYLTCGYLTTDKVWTEPTLTKVVNGRTYTIIEENTPLTQGFRVVTLPLSSLSSKDKAARKAPNVYVILADSYGIRFISVEGEVI